MTRMTMDRECVACGQDGDKPNKECDDHEPFDMTSDDAIETLHGLIRMARQLAATNEETRKAAIESMDWAIPRKKRARAS